MPNVFQPSTYSKISAFAIGALFILVASTGFGQSYLGKTPGNKGFTQHVGPVKPQKSGNSIGRNSVNQNSVNRNPRQLTITSSDRQNSSRRSSNRKSGKQDSQLSNQGLNYTPGLNRYSPVLVDLNRQLSNSRNSNRTNRGDFRSEPFFADRMQPSGVNPIAGPVVVQPTPPATQRILNQHFNSDAGSSSSNPGPQRIMNPFYQPQVKPTAAGSSVEPVVLQPPAPTAPVLETPTDDTPKNGTSF